jgi:OOP family OmpA-OmpF porin
MNLSAVIKQANPFHFVLVFALFLLTSMSAAAIANGFYTAVDVGQTSIDCLQPPGYSCANNKAAYRLSGGYNYNPYIGIEANYGNLGSVRLYGIWGGPNVIQERQFSSSQIAAIIMLPNSESLSLFFKLGFGRIWIDNTYSCCYKNTRNAALSSVLGLGAEYDLSKRFSVRTQYERQEEAILLGGKSFSILLLSAGLKWKF